MSSKARQFRRRPLAEEGEEEEVEGVAAAAAAAGAVVGAGGGARKGVAKAPLLSFGDEGEEVSQPAPRKRVVSVAVRASGAERSGAATAAHRPAAGREYSAQRLKELAAAQRTLPGSLRPSSEPPRSANLALAPAAAAHELDAPPHDSAAAFQRPTARPQLPAALARGLDELDGEEAGPAEGQPDAETIRRAKARRERARGAAGRAADFVPLSSGAAASAAAAEAGESASDQSGEEEDVRIPFPDSRQPPPPRPVLPPAPPSDDEEQAEGEEQWARQQLRKAGLGGPTLPRPPQQQPAASRAAAATAAACMASLRDGLARARGSADASGAELARTVSALAHSEEALLSYQAAAHAAAAKYRCVQEFRDYVRDLCDCLKDKAAVVEELEEHVASLHRAAADAYGDRIAADAADELPPAAAAVAAAHGALSRGAGEGPASEAAEAAAQMARLAGPIALPPSIDEFGRDMHASHRVNSARRAASRSARRAKACAALAPGSLSPAGSSDSSDGERMSLRAGEADALGAAAALFADADEEFCSVERVKARLLACKAATPAAYRDAYVALSAPAIFAPFVRLQLLAWSPLRPPHDGDDPTAAAAFDHQPWFQQLFDYGLLPSTHAAQGGQPDAMMGRDDPDGQLIPQLVRRVVLPKVALAVAHAWRPDRRRHSQRLAAVLRELGSFLEPQAGEPGGAHPLLALHAAVAAKLVEAAHAAQVPAWHPHATCVAGKHAGRVAASAAARATRLLASVGAFEGTLPRAALQAPALDALLARQLVPHLRALMQHAAGWAACARRLLRAALALPACWTQEGLPRGATSLAEVAMVLAKALADAALGPARCEAAARDASAALARLGCTAEAAALAAAYAQ